MSSSNESKPSEKLLHQQLRRIEAHKLFVNAKGPKAILGFMLREYLADRHTLITRKTIAAEVFKNDNDAAVGPSVGRLRGKLRSYYKHAGQSDPIKFEVLEDSCIPNVVWVRSPSVLVTNKGNEPGASNPELNAHLDLTVGAPLWNVPRPNFTGRTDFLAKLRNTLVSNSSTAIARPLAISGLAGVGKTQTAIEFAYRYRSSYKTLFWCNAASTDALLDDYVVARCNKEPQISTYLNRDSGRPFTVKHLKTDRLRYFAWGVWGTIPRCCKAIDSTIVRLDRLPAEPAVVHKSCYIRCATGRDALILLGELLFGPLAFLAGVRLALKKMERGILLSVIDCFSTSA